MNGWLPIVFIGLPLWIILIVFTCTMYIVNKKIDELSKKVNQFLAMEGKDLLKEANDTLKEARRMLILLKYGINIIQPITGTLSALSGIKSFLSVLSFSSKLFKKRKRR